MTRRGLLRGLAALAGVAAAWIAKRAWWDPRSSGTGLPSEQAERLASILETAFTRPGVREVGAAYLEGEPDEADPRVLVARLVQDWTPAERNAPPGAVVARTRRQHRSDFGAGRTVAVRGWILSRTEARLGALAAVR